MHAATTTPSPPTASTAVRATRRRSSSVSAEYSPSEPLGPTPRQPLATSQRQCSAYRSWSTASPAGAAASSR
ncbi:hypothetical protein [Actinomadura madurae]|uniref:hypothetical protein n=1 Tax=Actinomadura madurae TaxID=1993 RepID=UPI0020D24764|nr:hypothetical protein [Actinomadura madurae]MCQ0012922.1 hypothetical protein [Actinomadura madurae]